MTTLEPGASEVFTQGFTVRPFSTAFFASRPAPTSTEGFEVLVQEVIAAMTTAPSFTSYELPLAGTGTDLMSPPSVVMKLDFTSGRLMRSCGRFGPASDGTTLARSSSRVSENSGSGEPASRNMPCSR